MIFLNLSGFMKPKKKQANKETTLFCCTEHFPVFCLILITLNTPPSRMLQYNHLKNEVGTLILGGREMTTRFTKYFKTPDKLTRELRRISSLAVVGLYGMVEVSETQKPVSIFLHWPSAPSSTTSLKGKWRKNHLFTFLAARTADFNYGSSSTEEKTHIGKKKAMSYFQIKKTFLHVSITHRLLPFEANPPSFPLCLV